METIYTVILIILAALAVSGLFVGVTNDAVNFLNSAFGSKAAPRKIILLIASIGIIIGAITSSGMMEVARSGMFNPSLFSFKEVMMLYLAVMLANIILLDVYNSLGLPTSTTVSLIFCLLGSAIAVSTYKIANDPQLSMNSIGQFINTTRALGIVSAILLSVILAFTCGSIVMYISRIIFTFRYHKIFRHWGALWCGLSFTAIIYFALYKGLKNPLKDTAVIEFMNANLAVSLIIILVACTIILFILQRIGVNILKTTILAGTFSLALAFAGNDLVNFIGVPVAAIDSYKMASQSGDMNMMMSGLLEEAPANFLILLGAGIIMVITLWTSKKAMHVTETELKLANQNSDEEVKYGSTIFSRQIVRAALLANNAIKSITPEKLQTKLNRRFVPAAASERESGASFDLIRATVNLTTSSLLIAMATSMKLPLSTTYVTFMVAMGTSLADRAWGRESAVYRITGVMTVIAGWFITGFGAFIIAYLVGLALMYGGTVVALIISLLCGYMIIHNNIKASKTAEEPEEQDTDGAVSSNQILQSCIDEVCEVMQRVTRIYNRTLVAVFKENRKALREMVKESNDLFYESRDRKYKMMPVLYKLEDSDINTTHYYVQVVDYMSEITKALVHITRPCFDHIDNNHEGFSKEQVQDLISVNDHVKVIYDKINVMLTENDFRDIDKVLEMRDRLFDIIAEAIKNQLRRIKAGGTSTKSSVLYLTILNETKTMVLQSRNLLKSQRYFIENKKTEE